MALVRWRDRDGNSWPWTLGSFERQAVTAKRVQSNGLQSNDCGRENLGGQLLVDDLVVGTLTLNSQRELCCNFRAMILRHLVPEMSEFKSR